MSRGIRLIRHWAAQKGWRRATALVVVPTMVAVVLTVPAENASGQSDDHWACALANRPAVTAVPEDPAYPTFQQLPTDLAAHADSGWEGWYLVGQVCSGARRFGFQVAFTRSGRGGETNIAITDLATGRFYQKWTEFPTADVTASTADIDVRMPTGALSGSLDSLSLAGSLPQGDIDLDIRSTGPALYFGGTGHFPLWGTEVYNVELPFLAASGSLTIDGKTYQVSGQAWLDRMYFNGDFSKFRKWTWMAIELNNGDRIALLDNYSTVDEDHAATVLHPDGRLEIAAIEPLDRDAGNFWTSPATGKRFPTRWVVRIPSMDTKLVVDARPREQEIVRTNAASGVYEAAALASGTYQGRQVRGLTHVEMLGAWY